jgi:hypothetical protein
MKTLIRQSFLLALFVSLTLPSPSAPLGTAFNYQGRLNDGDNPAQGIYDLRFTIYDAFAGDGLVAGPLTNSPVTVSNGLFTVTLDFGAGVFTGDARWLEIAVRTNGGGAFTTLSPRQPLTAAPYGLWAAQAGAVADGSITSAALAGGAVTSDKIANGTIALADLGQNAATDGQMMSWSASQNQWVVGDIAGGPGFLGYRENGTFGVPPVASGNNAIAMGEHAQAVGNNSVVGGGLDNLAGHWFATIGGGWSNSAGGLLFGRTTVGGGEMNKAAGDWSTVGGGQLNTAGGPLWGRATVAGGWENTASGDMSAIGGGSQNSAVIGHAVIGGGQYNVVSNGAWSAIGGGYSNRVLGMAATVPGGAYNEALERASFAAGRRARALHPGAFVWADSTDADFASTRNNQFNVRATGGVSVDTGAGPGIALSAADTPLITRGWDLFGTTAPVGKQGHGRWGLFMETFRLAIGIPNVAGRYFEIAKYETNGTSAPMLTLNQAGNLGLGTPNPTSRLTVRGNVTVQSDTTGNTVAEIGEGLDYAEGFDVAGRAEIGPGSVLVIDTANPGKLAVSRDAYDRKVAGIVAGAKGLGSGVRLGAGRFDHVVALAGRVYCNVDATFGAVQPGDLLTTSATPGHAMVVKDHAQAAGAILGKAMETLAAGEQGQILVLVTLQ